MADARKTAPDVSALDIEALRALVLVQHAELLSRNTEIDNLKLLVLKLKRMQFGRKSEKLDRQIEQLELRLEDLEAAPRTAPAPAAFACRRARPEQARSPPAAGIVPAPHPDACAQTRGLPRLRRPAAAARRRRFGDARIRSGRTSR